MVMLDFQRNLLTTLLVAGLAGLVALGAVLPWLLGPVDVERIEATRAPTLEDVQVDAPETGLAEFDRYVSILEKPVFFSDRRLPVVEAPGEDEEMVVLEDEQVEQVEALKAAVAGIVITPELKLAMVNDESAGKTVVLREGMSLQGEQAAWRLETIEARTVRFVSVDGRETDLELSVNTQALTGAPPSPGRRSRDAAGQAAGEETQEADATAEEATEEARARAEEIRRRVAERRAQLRAEAEQRAQQQKGRQDN